MIHLNHLAHPGHLGGVRGIIFDCDGVLIDSLGSNTFFYNSFKEHYGLPPMTEEEAAYVHAHNVWESLRHILPGELYEQGLEHKWNYDYRQVLPHIKVEEGLRDFLLWARNMGLPMGIATSRTDTLDMVLEYFGLSGFFHPCITSFKVRNPKPNPESIHAVLASWRMSPDDVVFIGDSGVDEATALHANVRFWAYKNPALSSAQLCIPDFDILRTSMDKAFRLGFLFPEA